MKYQIGDLVKYRSGILRINSIQNSSYSPIYQLELFSYVTDWGGYVSEKLPSFLSVEESNLYKFHYKLPLFRMGEEIKYQDERYKIYGSWFYEGKYYYACYCDSFSYGGLEEQSIRKA